MRKPNTRLRIAIVESGRHQYEIADLAGIDTTILSMIINGRRPPTETQRKAIAKVLRRKEEDLFPEVAA